MDFKKNTRSEANKIVDEVVSLISKHFKSQKILEINNPYLPVFYHEGASCRIEYNPGFLNEINDKGFDLILANLPINLGPKRELKIGSINIGKVHENIINFFKLIDLLADKGQILFILPPQGFQSQSGQIELALKDKGLFVNAIFNTPKNILQGYTSIQPIIVLVSHNDSKGVFLGELIDEFQTIKLINNFFNNTPSGTLSDGAGIVNLVGGDKANPKGYPEVPHLRDWKGFQSFQSRLNVFKISSQFRDLKNFSPQSLGAAAVEINAVKSKEKFIHKNQSIYVPKIGNSSVHSNIEDLTLKHQNYLQVVLKDEYLPEYVSIFFESKLGKSYLDIHKTGFIPTLSKSNLRSVNFTYPNIEEQKKIILANKKLKDINNQIENLRKTLALNPTSSNETLDKLDMLCNVFNALTEQDKIFMLIREGESQKVEYKQTLSMDIKDGKKTNFIIHAALKTIVAFLNCSGGTLLVGIDDSGEVLGIDNELNSLYRNSEDNYFKYLKDVFRDRIGLDFWDYIEYQIVVVDKKKVLRVDCSPTDKPCYLDGKEFWIRTHPASDQLEGPQLISYVTKRFKQ